MASKPILAIAKEIIRKAAEIGLDQAGSLIMPMAWPYFKKVLAPVVEELQHRYPRMFLVGDENAISDSEKAVEALSTNSNLQKMLDDGFSELEHGQEQILAELHRMDEILRDTGTSIERLSEMTEDGFNEVLQALQEQRAKDASLQELDAKEDVKKQLKRAGLGGGAAAMMELGVAVLTFKMEVLERGEPNRTYKRDIVGAIKRYGKDLYIVPEVTEYRATPSGPYEDEFGRTCRDINMTHLEKRKWVTETDTFYRHRGKWVKIQQE